MIKGKLSLFKLFISFLRFIEPVVFEPLAWLLGILIIEGINHIKNAKEGNLYSNTRFRLFIDGLSMIIIAILLYWWYWISNFNSGLINV